MLPNYSISAFGRDITASIVVFLVALPLCLGIAVASDAPPFSGLVSGIIGGIVVGFLSGSHSSVSGPAAGLTAVVAAQIALLGDFQVFLLAVFIAGVMQFFLGLAKGGIISAFFPSSVIKGLLAAIGLILILKQIPHLFGVDTDPEGEMAFLQPDQETTFSELFNIIPNFVPAAAAIGISSLLLLLLWEKWTPLKKSGIPGALVVVLYGVGLAWLFQSLGGQWIIETSHLVTVPVAERPQDFFGFFIFPDFSAWNNPNVYIAALTIAAVASLETLLNLEAVDKIDPKQRKSPPSRELVAQGVGNMSAGLIGGIPVTSVIVRSSVNLNAGAQSKLSAIIHGFLLFFCVMFAATYLNMIPLAALAAILILTGFKLASPALLKHMWQMGRAQFIPFAVTVLAILLTDLLIGVLIGLLVAIFFILRSNVQRPLRRIVEKHLGGTVEHIELANQVSFLNRAALLRALNRIPEGGHVLIDARDTDYIDPDVLAMIRDYKDITAPARGVNVSLIGFKDLYQLEDQTQYVDYSTREIQTALTPAQVLKILKEGHYRFRSGHRLTRDFDRLVSATAQGQHPLAVVLGCIDSRTPAELIFDTGVGDIFSVRVAGNITSRKVLGSIEYATGVAGAKLILVLGHTRCGAVTSAVDLINEPQPARELTGCDHIDHVLDDIQQSTSAEECQAVERMSPDEKKAFVDEIARRNVARCVKLLADQSTTLSRLVTEGRIAIVGAIYNVGSGDIDFIPEAMVGDVTIPDDEEIRREFEEGRMPEGAQGNGSAYVKQADARNPSE